MPYQMSDKEVLSTLLTQQKFLAETYNQAASHTDDPQMLQTLTQLTAEKQVNRLSLYQAMHARGWYSPNLIDQTQLNQAKQKVYQAQQDIQAITQTGSWQQTGQTGSSPNGTVAGYTGQGQGANIQAGQEHGFHRP